MSRTLLSALALAATAFAATISIAVGEEGTLLFQPNDIKASVGDLLEFHFYTASGDHSVVSSSFSSPCVPDTNAFFSGYVQGDSKGDRTFVVPVNNTDPIWFYCSLGAHCQSGMVGVVNAAAGQTLDDYTSAAELVKQASAPSALVGGVLSSILPSATSSVASSVSSSVAQTTGTQTSASSATGSTGTATGTSASPTVGTTSATGGAAEMRDKGAVLAMAVLAGGLVALMA